MGLNLTGADTVIFVEHAWNPMKDLQAMDRAHRLGQRRVVNVYRLITRATLEEKIMGSVLPGEQLTIHVECYCCPSWLIIISRWKELFSWKAVVL